MPLYPIVVPVDIGPTRVAAEAARDRLAPGVTPTTSAVGTAAGVSSGVDTLVTRLPAQPGTAIKSIQRGIISISAPDTQTLATISVVDLAKAVVSFHGNMTFAAALADALASIRFESSTQVAANRIGGLSTTYVRFEIREFY